MAKNDPTKNAEFQRVLGNLLKTPPKPHSEMKVGKRKPVKNEARFWRFRQDKNCLACCFLFFGVVRTTIGQALSFDAL